MLVFLVRGYVLSFMSRVWGLRFTGLRDTYAGFVLNEGFRAVRG